jgi:hypothetical protein
MKKVYISLLFCTLWFMAATSYAADFKGYKRMVPPTTNPNDENYFTPHKVRLELSREPKLGETAQLTFGFSSEKDADFVNVQFGPLSGVEVISGKTKDVSEKKIRRNEIREYVLTVRFTGKYVNLGASASLMGKLSSNQEWDVEHGWTIVAVLERRVLVGDKYVLESEKKQGTQKDPAYWGNPTGYSAKTPWYGPENMRQDMEIFKQMTQGLTDIDARWLVDKAEYISFGGKCDKRIDGKYQAIANDIIEKSKKSKSSADGQLRRAIVQEMVKVFQSEAKNKNILDILQKEAADWRKNRPEEKLILPPGPLDDGGSPINSIYPDQKDSKATITVKGVFKYAKHKVDRAVGITDWVDPEPVRKALVYIWENAPTPTYLGKTMTLDNGSYSVNVTPVGTYPYHVWVVVHMTGPTYTGLDAYMVKVLSDTVAQYPTTPTIPYWRFHTDPKYDGNYDFGEYWVGIRHGLYPENVQPRSGAANIYDGILKGCEYFVPGRTDATTMGKVKVKWEPKYNKSTAYRTSVDTIDISGAYTAINGVINKTPDEWNTDVILHEFGHHVMAHCADTIPKAGGAHAWCKEYNVKLSFNEAWAHLVSSAVRSDSFRTSGIGGIEGLKVSWYNMENPWSYIWQGPNIAPPSPDPTKGAYCEATVVGSLWDIYDHTDELTAPPLPGKNKPDTLNVGLSNSVAFDTIFTILKTYDPDPLDLVYNHCRDVNDFQNGWTYLYGPEHDKALADIYQRHRIGYFGTIVMPGITVTGSSRSVQVDWKVQATTSKTQLFEVQRSDCEFGPYGLVDSINYTVGESLYTKKDSSVLYNMPYWYKIAQVDSNGLKAYTEADSASPFDLSAPPTPPAPVTGLSAIDNPSDNGNSIILSWTKSIDDPSAVAKYFIYKSSSTNADFICLDSVLTGVETYLDTTTIDGDTTYYIVRAHNGVNGTNSSLVWGISQNNLPPIAPLDLIIKLDASARISLTWKKNVESDLWGYKVYRSTTSGSGYVCVTTPVLLDTNYLDTIASYEKSYYYVVTAIDNAAPTNESNYSPEVSIYLPRLSTVSGATAYNNNSKLIYDALNTKLHLIYQGPYVISTWDYNLYYTESLDDGNTWSIDTAIGNGRNPVIDLDAAGHPCVAWGGGASPISFVRKASPWSSPIVPPLPQVCTISRTSMAIDNNDTAFVCYVGYNLPVNEETTEGEIHLAKFPVTDANIAIEEPLGVLGKTPMVAADANNDIHLAYVSADEIYYLARIDGVWGTPVNLSQTSAVTQHPMIDVYGDKVSITWEEDNGGSFDICNRILTVSTGFWTAVENVSNNLSNSINPVTAMTGYIYWADDSSGTYQIYRKRYIDGAGWLDSTKQRMTNNDSICNYPQITFSQTIDTTKILATWTQGNASPYVVVYQRNIAQPVAKIFVDGGTETASPFNISRDGYITFGSASYQSIDYGAEEVAYKFDNLNSNKDYKVSVTYYFENEASDTKSQSNKPLWHEQLKIDKQALATSKVKAGQPTTVEVLVPPQWYIKDGSIELTVNNINGKYAMATDVKLYEFSKLYSPVKATDGGAQTAFTMPIALPLTNQLYQNAPNPVSSQFTNIQYAVVNPGNVSLNIYNISGQLVKTLVNENRQPGYYNARWDGKEASGRKAASGVYFYRIQANGFDYTKKMVVLK